MASRTDAEYLGDMLQFAEEAIGLAAGKVRGDLDSDRTLCYALQHCFTVIGEAASHVSQGSRDRLPDVPWPDVIGMRNWIVHGYKRIDLDIIWKTAIEDLPPLVTAILDFLPPEQT